MKNYADNLHSQCLKQFRIYCLHRKDLMFKDRSEEMVAFVCV